jgi:hypothetical protein
MMRPSNTYTPGKHSPRFRGIGIAESILLALLTATGCGPSKTIMEGTVTLDGIPIKKGTIMLMPTNGKGQTAGCGIAAGKYHTEVSPGLMQVRSTANRKEGKMPDPLNPGSGAMIDRYVDYVPEKYNEKTELEVTLKPGLNKHDFKLESAKPQTR